MIVACGIARAHKVRFVAFDLPVPAGTCQLIPAENPKKPLTVDVGVSRFSAATDVAPGNYKLVLPDGKTSGILKLEGDAARKMLAIVLPGPEGTVGILTAPDEVASFAAGDRLFINATQYDIRVQIGDKDLAFKPGASQMMKPPGKSTEGRFAVRMGYLKEGKWGVFNSTWWPDDPTCRSLVLIFPNPQTGAPGVKTIEETPKKEN